MLQQVKNQPSFEGKVFFLNTANVGKKGKNVFGQVRPCLKNMVKNESYDLYIRAGLWDGVHIWAGGEKSGYKPVFKKSIHPELLISGAKEAIAKYKNTSQINPTKISFITRIKNMFK